MINWIRHLFVTQDAESGKLKTYRFIIRVLGDELSATKQKLAARELEIVHLKAELSPENR